ncbi:MAG: cystathionine gamma-synthase [Gemmatimonadota bacterium]|nr:cystathionine gamma-synthase [Gemmatimonadota bacterium]
MLEPAPRQTIAVRGGIATDTQHGAVIPPLHLSANFSFAGFGQKRDFDYTRSGNPTRQELADVLAELECGARGIVTASGMAAATLVLQLVRPGERIVAAHDCYGGTHRALVHLAARGQFGVEFADLTDVESARRAITAGARLVWIETPSNPLLRITDLRAVSALAHATGALVVADNTFLSPARQRPLALGADIVIHSTTKYLNGHSDVVGGAVVAADPAVGEELAWWCNCLGLAGAPFDSWLTLRGIRTLHPRLRQHEENAASLAMLLEAGPEVVAVHYPGLTSHPGHALASRQQDGFGGMLSFALRGGEAAARRFVEGLRWFTLAESLGGVESLIAHPATMTHASMSTEARRVAGISDGLLRLSIGIEDVRDLAEDLVRGLGRAAGASPRLAGAGA